MIEASAFHCLTGRPQQLVMVDGKPAERFQTLQHRDGSSWRYEGMSEGNVSVIVSSLDGTEGQKRFPLAEFGISISIGGKP